MANTQNSAALPVGSDSIQTILEAAFARIAEVPAGRTLFDEMASELWLNDIAENPAVGSTEHEDEELDNCDTEVKQIA